MNIEAVESYQKRFAKQPYLIGESMFSLTRSENKYISVGLSPILDFKPIIKIWTTRSYIILTILDFEDFLRYDPAKEETHAFGDYIMRPINFANDIMMIAISYQTTKIVISKETLQYLYTLYDTIDYKLNMLKFADFTKFYTNVLLRAKSINNTSATNIYLNIKSIIMNESNSINVLLMLECISMFSHKIDQDVKVLHF